LKPTAGISRAHAAAIATTKHPTKPGIVTIAGHPNVDIPKGALNSILKQARLKI
jgi:hypothetical protein